MRPSVRVFSRGSAAAVLGGITTTCTRGATEKAPAIGVPSPGEKYPGRVCRSAARERGHDVAREPAQLLVELLRAEPFRPMDHEIFEAGILRLDRLDAFDDVRG